MNDFHLIHSIDAAPVTVQVWCRHDGHQAEYRVRVSSHPAPAAPLTEEQLVVLRNALEQADYVIRFERQQALIGRCRGCGD